MHCRPLSIHSRRVKLLSQSIESEVYLKKKPKSKTLIQKSKSSQCSQEKIEYLKNPKLKGQIGCSASYENPIPKRKKNEKAEYRMHRNVKLLGNRKYTRFGNRKIPKNPSMVFIYTLKMEKGKEIGY